MKKYCSELDSKILELMKKGYKYYTIAKKVHLPATTTNYRRLEIQAHINEIEKYTDKDYEEYNLYLEKLTDRMMDVLSEYLVCDIDDCSLENIRLNVFSAIKEMLS